MKKLFYIFLFTILICIKGFSDSNLFSLPFLNSFINIYKNQPYSTSWFLTDINYESKDRVEVINDKLERFMPEHKKEQHVFNYNSSGLLIRETSKVYEEENYSCSYDEKDRLLSSGDFTYKYCDKNLRECYCRGELKTTEQISHSDNKIKITVTKFSKKYSDNSYFITGKEIYEYNFEDGKVKEIIRRTINRKGIEDKKIRIMKFEYEGNAINKITERYADKIQSIQNFEYNEGKLIRKTVIFENDSASDFISEYSDYDKYGNYTRYTEKSGNTLKVILSRNIKYRD